VHNRCFRRHLTGAGMLLATNAVLAFPGITPLNAPNTHTIHIVGAAADVTARIAAQLDELRTRFDARWRIADYASAELLLVHTDSVYGHMDWLRAEGSGRLVAALTSTPDAYTFAVSAPVVPDDLIAMLNRVGAHLAGEPLPAKAPAARTTDVPATPAPAAAAPHRPEAPSTRVPTAVAPPASTPAAAHAQTHAPDTTSGATLLDLINGKTPIYGRLHLQAAGLPELYIDTHDQTWHSAASLKGLTPWCTRAFGHGEVKVIGEADYTRQTATLASQPLARLKWLAHLVRSDGELEAGLDAKGRYKLSRWPQSEREFPKHFRIATVMLKQACTLDEIATQGGASTADVANFINAYNALGYIDREDHASAPGDSRGGGLFGRAKKTTTAS